MRSFYTYSLHLLKDIKSWSWTWLPHKLFRASLHDYIWMNNNDRGEINVQKISDYCVIFRLIVGFRSAGYNFGGICCILCVSMSFIDIFWCSKKCSLPEMQWLRECKYFTHYLWFILKPKINCTHKHTLY